MMTSMGESVQDYSWIQDFEAQNTIQDFGAQNTE